jgi:type IV pilus assembly protein PilC
MFFRKAIQAEDQATFFGQLSSHLKAGVPVGEALACIAEDAPRPAVRKLAAIIGGDLAKGTSIDVALKRQDELLGPVIAERLVAINTDSLEQVSNEIAEFLTKRAGIDQRIAYLNSWQKLTLVVAALMTFIILVFVAPAFKEVFASFGGELPAPTLFIIEVSDFVGEGWWIILLLWGGTLIANRRIPAVARAIGGLSLRLPGIGRKQRMVAAALVMDSAAFLAHRGMGSADAMRCAAGALDNANLRASWEQVAGKLDGGVSLADALQTSGIAPRSLVAHARAVPDASVSSLDEIVAANRDSAAWFVAAYGQRSRQVVTVILGIFVALLVIGLYLPIFKLGSVVG